MANGKPDKGPKGQDKIHLAHRVNPDTGVEETKSFTQREWRDRNKAEGWLRDDTEIPDEPGPDEPENP